MILFKLIIVDSSCFSDSEHYNLPMLVQMQIKKCSWLSNPPLVCAHGGDSSSAFPNTVCMSSHVHLDSLIP